MHFARYGKSKRLQVLDQALRKAGARGLTTLQLMVETRSCAVATDVSELRRNGVDVVCKYERTTPRGRKIYRYWRVA